MDANVEQQDMANYKMASMDDHFSALIKHQVHFSYGLVVIVLLLAGLAGYVMYRANKSFETELAKAQIREDVYRTDLKDTNDKLAAQSAVIQDKSVQQKIVVEVVHTTDTAADKRIAEVVKPGRNSTQAMNDLQNAYRGQLTFDTVTTPEGKLAFPVPQIQQFSATKFDRDRLSSDLVNSQKLTALEQQKSTAYQQQTVELQNVLKDCDNTLLTYKAIAKKSRFHRVLTAMKWAGAIGGTAFVSYEVGKGR